MLKAKKFSSNNSGIWQDLNIFFGILNICDVSTGCDSAEARKMLIPRSDLSTRVSTVSTVLSWLATGNVPARIFSTRHTAHVTIVSHTFTPFYQWLLLTLYLNVRPSSSYSRYLFGRYGLWYSMNVSVHFSDHNDNMWSNASGLNVESTRRVMLMCWQNVNSANRNICK